LLKLVFNQSTAYYELESWDNALAYAQQIVKIKKKDPRAYLTMGRCYYAKGMITESWRITKQGLNYSKAATDQEWKEKYVKFFEIVSKEYNERVNDGKLKFQDYHARNQYENSG